jgi:type I restriction enzyme, S subunit
MSWATAKIGEIAFVVTKGTTPTTYGMPFTDTGVNFIKAEALNGDCTLDRSGFTFVSESTHEKLKRSILDEHDVLVTIAGAQVGRCGIVHAEHLPANTNQAVAIIRVDRRQADPRFVYYFFKDPKTFRLCQGFGGQAAQPNINLAVLKSFDIRLPPLRVQNAIVETLSAYDALIENNRRRIALLEEAARMLYREWFVRLRFPGHEHVKIVNGLPEGWERRALGSVLNLQRGFDLPAGDRIAGDVPVYGSTGVVGDHNVPKVSFPTLVTGRSGSLGTVCFVDDPCWPLNTSLWITEFKAVSIYFAYFMLSEMNLAKFNGGASVPTLDRKVVHAANVVVPPLLLSTLFDEQARPLFSQRRVLEQQNKKLVQARDLILPRLMNGEIAV